MACVYLQRISIQLYQLLTEIRAVSHLTVSFLISDSVEVNFVNLTI